jgi:hypothetical protein
LFRIECMSIGHKFQPPIYRSRCRVRGGECIKKWVFKKKERNEKQKQ